MTDLFSCKGLFRYLQLFVVSNSVQTKYFCNENEIPITEGFSSVKDMMSKIGSAVKSGSEKVVDGFKKLGERYNKSRHF